MAPQRCLPMLGTYLRRRLLQAYQNKSFTRHTSSNLSFNDQTIPEKVLANPAWSVHSLLPTENQQSNASQITSKQLHHILRLSALPQPDNPDEEQSMLRTLSAQLHFVGEMQKVNTENVLPLRAIRDESAAAEKEQEITMETIKEALAREDTVGKHHRRIRRRAKSVDAKEAEDWNVLGSAERKFNRFFVVESERP